MSSSKAARYKSRRLITEPRRAPTARDWPRLAAIGLGVALAYIMSARVGFRLAFVAEQVTTVWPPTGIAQAALLLWGLRLWPAIWCAAFIVNATIEGPLWSAASIATGNTLEAVAAAWLLSRWGFNPALDRTRDTLAFITIGVVATTAISATIGTTSLCASDLESWDRFWTIWTEWWLGDALGSLVVAPVLLTMLRPGVCLTRSRKLETGAWVAASVAATALVFGRTLSTMSGHFPLAFTIFPFVIAAAVRLGHPATALVTLATIAVTLSNTVRGIGPFSTGAVHDALIQAQVFTGVLAGSGLLLRSRRHGAPRHRAAPGGCVRRRRSVGDIPGSDRGGTACSCRDRHEPRLAGRRVVDGRQRRRTDPLHKRVVPR